MKLVIVNSRTGFTKRYAEWIAEEIGAETEEFRNIKKIDPDRYDTIVVGSWVKVGTVQKKKEIDALLGRTRGKKRLLFVCGGNLPDSPEIHTFLSSKFNEPLYSDVEVFYCPGGMNYAKMSFADRLVMKMLVKIMRKSPEEADRKDAERLAGDFDISDRKWIGPIVDSLKKNS